MAFLGFVNGIPAYDRIEDVPESQLKSGLNFALVEDNLTPELRDRGITAYVTQSPLGLVGMAVLAVGIIATAVIVVAVAPIILETVRLKQIQSYEYDKTQTNPDGSTVWKNRAGGIVTLDQNGNVIGVVEPVTIPSTFGDIKTAITIAAVAGVVIIGAGLAIKFGPGIAESGKKAVASGKRVVASGKSAVAAGRAELRRKS